MQDDDEHWDAPIWRGRFRSYTPRDLVRWALRDTTSYVDRIALEVLDEKIAAMEATVPAAPRPDRRSAEPRPVPTADAAKR